MAEVEEKLEFHEPTSEEAAAGYRVFKKSRSPYDLYMEGEGIPIFHGIGVKDTRDLPLGDWKRYGGKGSFLALAGLEGVKGMFVVEVPPRGALNPIRHMYDEFFLVIEGRGTTEVWLEGQSKKQVFEWGPWTLFMIPINANYRIVNATSGRALLLSANNAPPIFNIFDSQRFIFENPYVFSERFGEDDNFFKPKQELEAEPVRGRASIRSNVFTDIANIELPLDNQRAPGYRRINPRFYGYRPNATTGGFISQYPSGRYSKGHYHNSGAVLVCLKGQGYSFGWPTELGPHPWENGHGDQVRMTEYGPGGLVAAAPGGGNWFHEHFSISKEPFRVINYWGGPVGMWGSIDEQGEGEDAKAGNLWGISEGGRTIMYHEEDPYIRNYYKQRLAENGVEFTMPEEQFQKS